MSTLEIIGVIIMLLSVIVLVGVMIHWMNADSKTEHYEKVIRIFGNREYYASEINHYLNNGWKVKFQSEPMVREYGEDYIEYVIYKDEPIKKGDNHDSKQDSM